LKYIIYKIKKVGIYLHSGLGNQMFMLFNMLSYYIDNCDDYIIYYNTTEFKTEIYYWDTMFSNLKDKISDTCDILNKYDANEFHYNKISEYDNDVVLHL
jgi:hypothetical protein